MLSKSHTKLIQSLKIKKNRIKSGLFIVEGIKSINEFITSNFVIDTIFCTIEVKDKIKTLNQHMVLINDKEFKKISCLKTSPKALALVQIPSPEFILKEELYLFCDSVRDPGNLGTIIRLADWFGISAVVCSEDSVDCYNPKVVQATMGSLKRVQVVYKDLNPILEKTTLPIFGAFMEGENIYKKNLPSSGILIMGNEANGISSDIESYVNHKVSIPSFGKRETESLNVAMATAILLNEFKRNFKNFF